MHSCSVIAVIACSLLYRNTCTCPPVNIILLGIDVLPCLGVGYIISGIYKYTHDVDHSNRLSASHPYAQQSALGRPLGSSARREVSAAGIEIREFAKFLGSLAMA